jgi:hypothetical protein
MNRPQWLHSQRFHDSYADIHPNASYFVQKVFVDIEAVYEK